MPKCPDPVLPWQASSTAVFSPVGTTTCHQFSHVDGSIQACCSIPSFSCNNSNLAHSPFVAMESPVMSSHGGLPSTLEPP